MKRIRNKLYWLIMWSALLFPLQVSAAGKDAVVLGQDGAEVAVSLNMSEAEEENITAVSVSLKVDAGNSELAAVDFAFAPELSEAECGYRYFENSDNTGRLDIYAVTGHAQSLFREGQLNLGNVKVTPGQPSQDMTVEISYYEGSFRTANAAYGEKMPVVDYSEPVQMQFGEEKPQPNPPGNDNNGGNGNNMDDGLYDDNTQFKNDPNDSQLIPSDIIGADGKQAGLTDLSKGLGKETKIKLKASGSSKEKVTVVAPEDGMSGILISKADGGSEASGSASAEENGTEAEEKTEEESKEVEEILLDQVNGGAVVPKKKGGTVLAVSLVAIIAIALIAFVIFVLGKKRAEEDEKERAKKRREERKKKAAKKKKTAGKQTPRGRK